MERIKNDIYDIIKNNIYCPISDEFNYVVTDKNHEFIFIDDNKVIFKMSSIATTLLIKLTDYCSKNKLIIKLYGVIDIDCGDNVIKVEISKQ